MTPLITLNRIYKQHGVEVLFKDFSFTINPKERIGIIGPNGSGKSTLLKIIAKIEEVDGGEVMSSRNLISSYAAQSFSESRKLSIDQFISDFEEKAQIVSILDEFDLKDLSLIIQNLSGGQLKKLQLAITLTKDSNLILLDEPSNHLDYKSIIKLQEKLNSIPSACVLISHDRWLLETYPDKIIEINPTFENGYFVSEGSYGDFLSQRELFLEAESQRVSSLKSKVRDEITWLRQGAKARSTKSKHRTESAHSLIKKLKESTLRRISSQSQIEFVSSGRKTKDLVELIGVSKSYNDQVVFKELSLKIQAGAKIGLMGDNGSGKSTILKLILNEIKPDSGEIKRANALKISYFSQIAKEIPPEIPLQKVLSPEGDSVVFQGRSIHVAGWASRFQFNPRNLLQPFGSLSGGEKAKARIANLILENSDVLLLDEPTNDLDIPTLEVLEESLLSYPGALILVSHDRFMLSKVCNSILGLSKSSSPKIFASYEQWFDYENNFEKKPEEVREDKLSELGKVKKTSRLTYKEQREYDLIESDLVALESQIEELTKLAQGSSGEEMNKAYSKLGETQSKIDYLYQRWEELEKKVKVP